MHFAFHMLVYTDWLQCIYHEKNYITCSLFGSFFGSWLKKGAKTLDFSASYVLNLTFTLEMEHFGKD